MNSEFINVELEIWSASRLDDLLEEMGKRVTVHHCGPAPKRHLLAIANVRRYKSPDSDIHALCKLIESLSPAGRCKWTASRKTFDMGFSYSATEPSSHFALRPDTLARMARLGVSLAVSYYKEDSLNAVGGGKGQVL